MSIVLFRNLITKRKIMLKIGSKSFKSQIEALSYYKKILHCYNKGQFLNVQHFDDIKELILYHYQIANFLLDKEIIKIIVNGHIKYKNTKCFYIIFSDESKEIFSYRLALQGISSESKLFSNACREAISDRLRKFKKNIFKQRPVICAITSKELEWEECHIDHKSPLVFAVIVKAFIVSNNLDIYNIEFVNNYGIISFQDINIRNNFDEFHRKMAVLRIVSKDENLKLSAKSRIKPTTKDYEL